MSNCILNKQAYSTGAIDHLYDLAYAAGADYCVKKPGSIDGLARGITLIAERLEIQQRQLD